MLALLDSILRARAFQYNAVSLWAYLDQSHHRVEKSAVIVINKRDRRGAEQSTVSVVYREMSKPLLRRVAYQSESYYRLRRNAR